MGTQLKQAMIAAGAHKIKVRRTKHTVQRTPQRRATSGALWVKDTQPGPLTRK